MSLLTASNVSHTDHKGCLMPAKNGQNPNRSQGLRLQFLIQLHLTQERERPQMACKIITTTTNTIVTSKTLHPLLQSLPRLVTTRASCNRCHRDGTLFQPPFKPVVHIMVPARTQIINISCISMRTCNSIRMLFEPRFKPLAHLIMLRCSSHRSLFKPRFKLVVIILGTMSQMLDDLRPVTQAKCLQSILTIIPTITTGEIRGAYKLIPMCHSSGQEGLFP